MVTLPEFRGTAPLFLAEDAVEIAQVIKATTITDLCNTISTVNKQPAGKAQSHVDDIVCQVTARMQLKEAAEGTGAHTGNLSQFRKSDVLSIVLADIILHLQYTTAITGYIDLCVTAGSQRACPFAA